MHDILDHHLADLLAGVVDLLHVDGDEVVADRAPPAALVVPGSFDPLHDGHLALAAAAAAAVGAAGLGDRTPLFELAVRNVDKPSLGAAEVRRRVAALATHAPVVVTAAPRFDAKARLLPGAVFAVGHDTAVRLVDPAYYAGVRERDRALAAIGAAGCLVAVAGRALGDGPYRELADVAVPPAHRELFLPVPGFRRDVSSTELRGAG